MSTPTRRRVRRSAEQWRQLLDEQQHSALSQKAFCQREGISMGSFQNWKRRLSTPASSPSPDWVEIPSAPDSHRTGWDIELDLGEGLVLRLRRH